MFRTGPIKNPCGTHYCSTDGSSGWLSPDFRPPRSGGLDQKRGVDSCCSLPSNVLVEGRNDERGPRTIVCHSRAGGNPGGGQRPIETGIAKRTEDYFGGASLKSRPPRPSEKLSTAEHSLGLLAVLVARLIVGPSARNMNHGENCCEMKVFEGGTHRVSLMHLHACSSSCRMDVRHRGHESQKDPHPRNGRRASAQNVPLPHVTRWIRRRRVDSCCSLDNRCGNPCKPESSSHLRSQ